MLIDKVLLIGNGINNIEADAGYRWKNLVSDLIKNFSVSRKIKTGGKPFPLLYEEIFSDAVGSGRYKESELKKFIAEKTFDIIHPNEIHDALIKLQFKNILTTNYDYNLEYNIRSNSKLYRNIGFKKETVYSLYRHHALNKINFWHIHGEAKYPQTINLGYEQYGGYLQFIRNYLVNGIDDEGGKEVLKPFIQRLLNYNDEIYSWADFFFTKDIFITGLTLSLDEMHLWWLLSFRERFRLRNRGKININNSIFYFYPKKFSSKPKLDLLQSFGVKTICINADGKKFYDEVIAAINEY